MKTDPWQRFNTPSFYAIGSAIAVVAWLLGWIGYETVIVCVGAALVGLYLHKKKKTDSAESRNGDSG